MRLKNIKGAPKYVENNEYTKFNINEIDVPIHLEIGCGKCDFLIEMAKQNPDKFFIGIEKYASVLYKGLKKIENENISNLKFLCIDATDINEYFKNKIEILYLNFSDPWHKNKHHRRRLTSHDFLKLYDNFFKKDCIIYQKTDNKNLFEYSIESLSTYGYTLKNISVNLHEDIDFNNIVTEYETKFSKLGPIYRLEAYKSI
ncbi:MAG: tRNA (guanosine(46)-N7)-methyltransferase TrmB [Bacilli bacterium]